MSHTNVTNYTFKNVFTEYRYNNIAPISFFSLLAITKYLTDEVCSSPFVVIIIVAKTNEEIDVALVLQVWLHTNCTISVYHCTHHHDVLEEAHDFLTFVEARPGDVDDGAAQHVSAFRGENQRYVCSSYALS